PAASAVVEELLDLERIAELWPAVVDRVREAGSELQSTFFAAARPVAIEGEPPRSLKIGFPPSAAFNKRKAESQDAREGLTEAIRSAQELATSKLGGIAGGGGLGGLGLPGM